VRRLIAILIAALAFGALSGVAAYQKTRPPAFDDAGWQEIAWPFPRDGWPAGRAFRCSTCGTGVEVYVRPKLGFCNCDSGVADDDEVDRVADLDLMSEHFVPLEAGKVIRIAEMTGRSRPYDLRMPGGATHTAIGIALSHRCNLLVAVAHGNGAAADMQRVAVAFLESVAVKNWMTSAMEGS
jgi:hypothetical protein